MSSINLHMFWFINKCTWNMLLDKPSETGLAVLKVVPLTWQGSSTIKTNKIVF